MIGICGGYTTFSSFQPANDGPGARRRLAARRSELRPFPGLLSRRRLARPECDLDLLYSLDKLVMQLPEDALLLRIYLGESDRWQHQPLYEAIVLKARALHLAGATVLRGPMGFGAASRIHTAKILRLSIDLPLVIEIVDTEEKVQGFLPVLDEMMGGGLVTLEKVRVIHYRDGAKDS